MKKLILALSIVSLLAAGCNSNQPTGQEQPNQQTAENQPTTPTPTPSSTPTPQPTPSSVQTNWITYTSTQYGFQIKFPSYWGGYKTDTNQLTDGGTSIGFNFPYTLNGKKAYYNHAIQIIMYPVATWPSVRLSDGSKPSKLGENNKYIYTYAVGQDLGGNSELEKANKDIAQIIATFKLTALPTSHEAPTGWETYQGDFSNIFTFDYPSEWNVSDTPGNTVQLRSLQASASYGIGLLGPEEIGVEITKSAGDNTQAVKDWCENQISKSQFSTQTVIFSNGKTTTVNGNSAYSIDFQIKEDARLSGKQICVAKGNSKYILLAYPLNSNKMSFFNSIVASVTIK